MKIIQLVSLLVCFAFPLLSSSASEAKNELGTWRDDRPFAGATMVLYESSLGTFLKSSYKDGSSGIEELDVTATPNGKRIETKGGNKFGEYFIINSLGELEFWSEGEKYYTAKKANL